MHSKELIREALQARHYEGPYSEHHVRKAIAAAEATGADKARVSVDVLKDLLPRAHRVSS